MNFTVQGNLSVLDRKKENWSPVMLHTHKAYLQIITFRTIQLNLKLKIDKVKQCKMETILLSILFIGAEKMLT